MNSIVCMDNTILKIVQIFVFVPHLLLMNMNSSYALQGVASQDAEPACARLSLYCNPRFSLLRQGEKVCPPDNRLVLELSLS